MDLRPYVETIHHQLAVAAEAGGHESRAVGERLTAAVDSAVRLALQDALVAAAEEITCELAPGSVELRLRGRDPEFVVRPPPTFGGAQLGPAFDEGGAAENAPAPRTSAELPAGVDPGGTARVNLRLPDQLKARAEHAAANEGVSLNTWLVKAVTAAVDRAGAPTRDDCTERSRRQRFVGWAR
jgi:hypothetical protein